MGGARHGGGGLAPGARAGSERGAAVAAGCERAGVLAAGARRPVAGASVRVDWQRVRGGRSQARKTKAAVRGTPPSARPLTSYMVARARVLPVLVPISIVEFVVLNVLFVPLIGTEELAGAVEIAGDDLVLILVEGELGELVIACIEHLFVFKK